MSSLYESKAVVENQLLHKRKGGGLHCPFLDPLLSLDHRQQAKNVAGSLNHFILRFARLPPIKRGTPQQEMPAEGYV
jgi:hypothetical protein